MLMDNISLWDTGINLLAAANKTTLQPIYQPFTAVDGL